MNIRKDVSGWFIVFGIFLLASCKDKEQPVITIPEQINASVKPTEDSLRKEVEQLKDSVAIYKQLAAKAAVRKEVSREKVHDASAQVNTAEKNGDTLALVIALKEQVKEADAFIVQADQQAEAQGTIISNQERIITAQLADIELQKSKYKLLRDAYDSQAVYVQQIRSELTKKDRKLHRAKFLNKVLGVGTAAGVALAAIVFL